MTDKDIIKALENAKSVVDDNDNETLDFFNNCIDLINRQQAEIERLMDLNDTVIADLKYYLDNNEENGVVYFPKFFVEKILRNLKEMVGE